LKKKKTKKKKKRISYVGTIDDDELRAAQEEFIKGIYTGVETHALRSSHQDDRPGFYFVQWSLALTTTRGFQTNSFANRGACIIFGPFCEPKLLYKPQNSKQP
jgi:hypothetical protein